jgi:hypothetical protein
MLTLGVCTNGGPTSGYCAKPSGKVLETHSVGSIFDYNLGVFAVPEIALKNTSAAPPAHPVSGTKAGRHGW